MVKSSVTENILAVRLMRAKWELLFQEFVILSLILVAVILIYLFFVWGGGPEAVIWSFYYSQFLESIGLGKHIVTLTLTTITAPSGVPAVVYAYDAASIANSPYFQNFTGEYIRELRSFSFISGILVYLLGFMVFRFRLEKLKEGMKMIKRFFRWSNPFRDVVLFKKVYAANFELSVLKTIRKPEVFAALHQALAVFSFSSFCWAVTISCAIELLKS